MTAARAKEVSNVNGTRDRNDEVDTWGSVVGLISLLALAGTCVYVWWFMFPRYLMYEDNPLFHAPASVVFAKAALLLRIPLALIALLVSALDLAQARREGIRAMPTIPKRLGYFCLVVAPFTVLGLGLGMYGKHFSIPPGYGGVT